MKRWLGGMVCLCLLGCAYHNEEELYGSANTGQCNLGTVTYALTVKPLLQQHCYSCHTSTFPSGNVALDTYAQVKKHTDSGLLMATINHLPGYPAMPKGAAKLPACDIARISRWVDSGAPDN